VVFLDEAGTEGLGAERRSQPQRGNAMRETQDEHEHRLREMSDEIDHLRKKERLDLVDIHKRLLEQWPTLSSREVDEALIWWETRRQLSSNSAH
jgi:hypothetical protein